MLRIVMCAVASGSLLVALVGCQDLGAAANAVANGVISGGIPDLDLANMSMRQRAAHSKALLNEFAELDESTGQRDLDSFGDALSGSVPEDVPLTLYDRRATEKLEDLTGADSGVIHQKYQTTRRDIIEDHSDSEGVQLSAKEVARQTFEHLVGAAEADY